MSKPRPKKILDALDALSGDDSSGSSSGSGSESEGGQAAHKQPVLPAAKKQKAGGGGISLEDLQAQGYTSGPSVLYMKPPEEEAQTNWAWSDGKAQKGGEAAEESLEERRQTNAAATSAAEEGARLALKAVEQAAKLRAEARAEQEALRKKGQGLSFNQKEKRKRDAGQQSRGKSTVEEEKRIARQFGVYSGFD